MNTGIEIEQGSLFEPAEMEQQKTALTLLCYGAGQDSTAILYKIMNDPDYRAKYVEGHLLVVMCDTGAEHPKTYQHIKRTKVLCEKHDIEFHFITGNMGFSSKGWERGLIGQYKLRSVIGMLGGMQLCTDHLKIKPTDRFLSYWLNSKYQLKTSSKIHTGIYDFVAKHGRIRMILGFAYGEGRDVKSGKLDPVWKKRCIDRSYPLVEEKWGRLECQEYINSLPAEYVLPPPSNCTICFFMSKQELVWLDRFMPATMQLWIKLEQNKLAKDKELERPISNGASGSKKLLPQRLTEAKELFGHWTDAELDEYKMSHGHCVKTTF